MSRSAEIFSIFCHAKYINMPNSKGEYPINIALSTQSRYKIKKLIDAGANLNTSSALYTSPLHQSLASKFYSGSILLIKHGANLYKKNDFDESAALLIENISYSPLADLVSLIRKYHANGLSAQMINDAIDNDRIDFIDYLLLNIENINEKFDGLNVLARVIQSEGSTKKMAQLRLLLDAGLSANGEKSDTLVPIIVATQLAKREFISMLLRKNANINKADIKGKTAIAYSVENLDVYTTKYLLIRGADTKTDDICSYLPEQRGWWPWRNYTEEQRDAIKRLEQLLYCQD